MDEPESTPESSAAQPTEANSAEAPSLLTPEEIEQRRDLVIEVCRHIYDPEIPVNIYDLGLIYNIDVKPTGEVSVLMTLTSPNCPEAEALPSSVQLHVRSVLRIKNVSVGLVWDPPWSWERMSEAARLEFGF
mgnify:CR=1 FL=1